MIQEFSEDEDTGYEEEDEEEDEEAPDIEEDEEALLAAELAKTKKKKKPSLLSRFCKSLFCCCFCCCCRGKRKRKKKKKQAAATGLSLSAMPCCNCAVCRAGSYANEVAKNIIGFFTGSLLMFVFYCVFRYDNNTSSIWAISCVGLGLYKLLYSQLTFALSNYGMCHEMIKV